MNNILKDYIIKINDDNTNCNGQGIVDDNGKCTCNDSQEVLGASCNQLQIGNWQIYMATNK